MNPRYQLPGELTIYSAMETRDSLLAWVSAQSAQAGGTLEVCADQVREVDGSGLQLLAALSHTNLPWRLVEPSEALDAACRCIGLTEWLREVSRTPQGAGQ